jgi:hypothetical protein
LTRGRSWGIINIDFEGDIMDRNKKSLKTGVVGLNPAEQRQVRGGGAIGGSLRNYRYYLSYQRQNRRNNLIWMSGGRFVK